MATAEFAGRGSAGIDADRGALDRDNTTAAGDGPSDAAGPQRKPRAGAAAGRRGVPLLIACLATTVVATMALQVYEGQLEAVRADHLDRTANLMRLAWEIRVDAADAATARGEAFASMQGARRAFASVLGSLADGDPEAGAPPMAERYRASLAPVISHWGEVDAALDTAASHRAAIDRVMARVAAVNGLAPELMARADEIVNVIVLEPGDAALLPHAARLGALAQALVAAANAHALGRSGRAAEQLRTGLVSLEGLLAELSDGGGPRVGTSLEGAAPVFAGLVSAAAGIVDDAEAFALARAASVAVGAPLDGLVAAIGNLRRELAASRSGDEITYWRWVCGALGILFLALLVGALIADARRRAAVSTRRYQDTQDSIRRLLDELGGPTADAEAAAGAADRQPGATADPVNLAVSEMRGLMARIRDGTRRAAGESTSAATTVKALLTASTSQAGEIARVAESVRSGSAALQRLADDALSTAEMAKDALAGAKRGTGIVRDTVLSVDGVRSQIRDALGRIERLGEGIGRLGDAAVVVEEIAERTKVAATNAAIQATPAGAPDGGIIALADDLQALAERVGEASRVFESLARQIRSDAHEALVSLEFARQGVLNGTRLAEAARSVMAEIEHSSERLHGLASSIAESALAQVETGADVSNRLTFIRDVARNAAQNTKYTADSIAKLTRISAELDRAVAGLKTPVRDV